MSKVAFLLANDFEDSEMKVPYEEVLQAGHQAEIIGLKKNETLLGKKEAYPIQRIKRSARSQPKNMMR